MIRALVIGLALAALSGCAIMQTGKPPAATAPSGEFRPSGPLALGDYEKDSEGAVRGEFARTVSQRYVLGAPMAQVQKDLTDNRFPCTVPPKNGGDPPDQVCRRQIKTGGCTFTYQVHLFNDPGKTGISRVRGLYDRACGEELLGG